jgi:hypothetical protein
MKLRCDHDRTRTACEKFIIVSTTTGTINFLIIHIYKGSWGSSVSMVSGYRLDDQEIEV